MFRHILNNIFTTVAGCFAGAPILIEGVGTHNPEKIVTGFSVLLLGLLSKDAHK